MSRPATPTAAILTLGCKLNLADSEAMALRLRAGGWTISEKLSPDVTAVVVNSCSVTHAADQKSKHLLRNARRIAPNATLALTGCLLETAPPDALATLDADIVAKQPHQSALADALIALHPAPSPEFDAQLARDGEAAPHRAFKTRAFIAAQEGCDDVCAFCVIPRTRGRERSKSIEAVVAEAQAREAEGAREIVVTGTQLGAYGRETGERRLTALIEALLRETSVPRIRVSSVQPQDLSRALIELWQDGRLCRHFHLALQSGCDATLARMRRRYMTHEFAAAVEALRAAIPDVAVTTDVIAGFPGETDAEFNASLSFCRDTAFAAMHVFPYSQRLHTTAEKLPGQVSELVKKARVAALIALGEEASAAYRRRFVGTCTDVLWEAPREPGVWEGLTDNYLRVHTESDAGLYNTLTPVLITGERSDGLAGRVVGEGEAR